MTALSALSQRPTVGLVMETEESQAAWALILSEPGAETVIEYHRIPSRLDTDARRATMLAAVDRAVAFAQQGRHPTVDLAVYHSTARSELLELGGEFGPVFVLPRSAISFEHPTYLAVVAETHHLIGKPQTHNPCAFTAATDGSYHRRYGGGAYGWVTESGAHGRGVINVSSPLEAELYAILNLLNATRRGSKVHLLVDSRDAIDAITHGAIPRRRKPLPSTTVVILDQIAARRSQVDFDLEWVKGHAGQVLNDAADRLARLARQSHMFNTPRPSSDAIAKDIVRGALAAPDDSSSERPLTSRS